MLNNMNFSILIALVISVTSSINAGENSQELSSNNKVKIKVFYETLCPWSVIFFSSQLRPLLEKLAAHVDVQLVPYGLAETNFDGHYKFDCHHGAAECYGNKLHACVIDVTQNSTLATLFNTCLLKNTVRRRYGYDYHFALSSCAYTMKIKVQLVQAIKDCVKSDRGSQLLNSHGEDTKQQTVEYVPYLMVNGREVEGEAAKNLKATVCDSLRPTPAECLSS